MKEKFIDWDEKYSVGVQTIDEQHKELFELVNDLYDMCVKGGNTHEDFKPVLKKTVNYVVLHFSHEEELMKAYNDPNYELHQKEHDIFVQKVMHEAAHLEKGKDYAPEPFMNFLSDWIHDHISGIDVKIGEHIASVTEKG